MYFLPVLLYCLVFCLFICMFCCFCRASTRGRIFTDAPSKLLNILWSRFVSQFAKDVVNKMMNAIFYEKNCFFQMVYILSVLVAHGVLLLKVLPLLYHYSWDENHILVGMSCLFFNAFTYVVICISNPGVVTPRTIEVYSEVYSHENSPAQQKMCDLCGNKRPTRTKHCYYCDHCVHRFDHHCVWSNSCIGGLNYAVFLAFLCSLVVMTANAFWLCIKCLRLYTINQRLWEASYLDELNGAQQMNVQVLVQHLFNTFPVIVISLMVFGLLQVIFSIYLLFHTWLVCINRTSCEFFSGQQVRSYSRGLWGNVAEAFLGGYALSFRRVANLSHRKMK